MRGLGSGGGRPIAIAYLVALIAFALPSSGYSQRRASTPSSCRLEPVGAGTVTTIVDGRSFLLDDGREVRLPGIEVPLPPLPGETGPRAEAGSAARGALASMLAGEAVELRAAAL